MSGDKMNGLVKSKQRVADHGEVFTPPELVEAMIAQVQSEAERIDSRFLEPACGSGNFLVPVLRRKLTTVDSRYRKSEFERMHQGLLALMSIYGIELLPDNVEECRTNLHNEYVSWLGKAGTDASLQAATNVLKINIVHGDALSMTTQSEDLQPITFSEWSYLGKGRFQRRDFRFDTLTKMASFGDQDALFEDQNSLFADLGNHEIFTPTRDHGTLTVAEIAGAHDD